jgi:hypothetical protein
MRKQNGQRMDGKLHELKGKCNDKTGQNARMGDKLNMGEGENARLNGKL